VARLLSFTRAAEELFLAQPTVSMQIKKLESDIGLALTEQVGKKISLTDAGKALCQACRDILDTLGRFEMQVDDQKGLKTGELRIAVVTTAKYFSPRLLGKFCQCYPGINMFLEVGNREHILDRMSRNLDDLYFVGKPPESSDPVESDSRLSQKPLLTSCTRKAHRCYPRIFSTSCRLAMLICVNT